MSLFGPGSGNPRRNRPGASGLPARLVNVEPANQVREFTIVKRNQSIVSGLDVKNLTGDLHRKVFVYRGNVQPREYTVWSEEA